MIPRNRPASTIRQPEPAPAAPDPALAPPPETIEVRDVDVAFSSGRISNLTLGPGDELSEDDRTLTVRYASGEVVTMNRASVEWVSMRTRRVIKPAAAFKPSQTEAADAARTN
jgi:hypothetical protein